MDTGMKEGWWGGGGRWWRESNHMHVDIHDIFFSKFLNECTVTMFKFGAH